MIVESSSSHSVSTASSSDQDSDMQNSSVPPSVNPQRDWEKFDEEEASVLNDRPPLPPPRSELESLYNSTEPSRLQSSSPPVKFVIDGPPVENISTNPFAASDNASSQSRSRSPLENFSSSIAEALIHNSEDKLAEDPTSASTLATTGRELFETIQEQCGGEAVVVESFDSEVSSSSTPVLKPSVSASDSSSCTVSLSQSASTPASLSTIGTTSLFNPVSTGSPTSDVSTAQVRTHINTIVPNPPRHRSSSINRRIHSTSVLRPIPQEGTFNADSIANHTNPFFSGSVNAGNYPALIPLPQKPSGPRSPSYVQNFPLPGSSRPGSHSPGVRRGGKPPVKPPPYSGDCQWNQQVNGNNSNAGTNEVVLRRQASTTFQPQRLPSLGEFDPFGDLFSSDGEMTGYVLQNSNALH